MATPKLTNVSWLGPKDEMDRASHLSGKCSIGKKWAVSPCVVTSVRAGNPFFMTVEPFTEDPDSATFHRGW